MGFMEQATDQAGREFGSRFWRWFAAGRIIKKAAPVLAVLAVAVALVLGYRALDPNWSVLGGGAAAGINSAGRWLVLLTAVAAGLALLAAVVWGLVRLWKAHSWRWRLRLSRF
jgi:hypothetical protein